MATQHNLPATDSATVLHELVGDDATASFESDPTFIENSLGDSASSENLQTRADRRDIQAQPDLTPLGAAADAEEDEEDDEDEDEDDEEDDDLEDDDEDEDELDDEDEDDELDEDDDDEDEDDEDEDDA